MNLFDKTLAKQGQLLLNKENYAYILVILFSGLPFLSWIALTIIALVTLRKGYEEGLKTLGIGVFTALITYYIVSANHTFAFSKVLFTFIPIYLSAVILRATAKWRDVIIAMLCLASLVIIYLFYFPPGIIFKIYDLLLVVLKENKDTALQYKAWLTNKNETMAYILGIQALVFVLSNFSVLMLARAIQAKLFYPQGFKHEMLNIRANPLALALVSCMFIGFYFKNAIFISLLPIWLAYFCGSGISILIYIFATDRALVVFLLLLILLSFLPIFMLALLASIGALDCLINFRELANKGNFTNKS